MTPEIAAASIRNVVKNPADEGVSSFASIKTVAVAGPDSIDLRLSEPNAFVLPDLSVVNPTKPGDDSINLGPYRVASRDERGIFLTAFPQYYRGRPSISEIHLTNYSTQRKAWTALMRGDIDMLYEVSRDAADFVAAETTVRTYTATRPYYIPLVFNVKNPVLSNPEVRKAINEALDRDTLVRDGLNNRGRPADGPILPEHWAHSQSKTSFHFDPDSARRRLDAAGYRLRPSAARTPSRLSFTCVVFDEDARFERLAVLAQKQLADVGIEMRLLPLKAQDLVARVQTGNFDAFLFEMYGRTLSSAYDWWHSHGEHERMNSGYTAADAVLDRMRSSKSEDEMKAAVADFAQVLYDDPPAAFIAWQEASRAVSARFAIEPEPGRDILGNVWQWHLADPAKQASR